MESGNVLEEVDERRGVSEIDFHAVANVRAARESEAVWWVVGMTTPQSCLTGSPVGVLRQLYGHIRFRKTPLVVNTDSQ